MEIKMKSNKGQMTMFLFFLIFFVFLSAIMIFVGGFITIKINSVLDQDIDLGQVNLREINDDTFGIFTTMVMNNADWWGISIIFGLVGGIFLSAYFMRGKFTKIAIILDIFFIIIAYIVSLYISSSYQLLLDTLSSAGEPFLEQYASKTSMFILNLPMFVTIIGVVSFIIFHSSIPRKSEERYQEGGYLQGAY